MVSHGDELSQADMEKLIEELDDTDTMGFIPKAKPYRPDPREPLLTILAFVFLLLCGGSLFCCGYLLGKFTG